MKSKYSRFLIPFVLILVLFGLWTLKETNGFTKNDIGQPIDSLNGVYVYYNGSVSNVAGRNMTADGYNLGLKYQCVEFVKRYYYEHLNHKMPDSYGHAKDFFDGRLADGQKNQIRDLTQFTNPSTSQPMEDDLLIFDGTSFNEYGHVAIISKVSNDKVEIIQQNTGRNGKSRETFKLIHENGFWQIKNDRVLGWLRK